MPNPERVPQTPCGIAMAAHGLSGADLLNVCLNDIDAASTDHDPQNLRVTGKMLKDHGVSNYSIFLHSETRQLFGYAEIESEEQWASIASTEVCQRWWKHMSDIMAYNPDDTPAAVNLREVFHLA